MNSRGSQCAGSIRASSPPASDLTGRPPQHFLALCTFVLRTAELVHVLLLRPADIVRMGMDQGRSAPLAPAVPPVCPALDAVAGRMPNGADSGRSLWPSRSTHTSATPGRAS